MRSLILLLLLAAPAAQADTCLWTGTNGTSWHTPTSWSCGRIPTAADDVTLNTFNNVPAVSAAVEAQSLTLLSNTQLVVGNGATVGTVLVGSGATLTVNATAATIDALTVNGGARIDGTATVTVTGGLTLGTGTIGSGTGGVLVLAPGSVSTIAAGPDTFATILGHTLRNEGTLRWVARAVQVVLNGRITNANGALLEVSAANVMLAGGGQGAGFLDNLAGGIVRKTGTGTTTLGGQQGVAFANDGTVEVTEGVLQLGNGVSAPTSTGRFEVSSGATLRFSGNSTSPQPYTLAPGSEVTGAGTVEVTGGAVVVQGAITSAAMRVSESGLLQAAAVGTVTPGALTVDGGFVSGTGLDAGGLVAVAGPFVWSGGRVGLQGSVEVRAEGTTTIGVGEHILFGTVVVAGAGAWTAGNVLGGGVLSVAPGGTLTVSAEAALVSPGGQGLGVLRNEGTVRKTGPGVTTIGGPQGFRIDNRGLFEVAEGTLQLDGTFVDPIPQTAGAFRLTGGAVTGPRAYVLDGGTLEGNGSVTPPVTVGSLGGSTAALVPGGEDAIGTLALAALTLRSGAILDVELGGTEAGQFDQVTVGGNLALAGTLRVRLADGFVPAVGDRFPAVTCSGTCSGTFSVLDLPDGLTASVEVTAQRAELVVAAVVAGEPVPGILAALSLSVSPNPARGALAVRVGVREAGTVRVAVYDALGREVAVLADGPRQPGEHEVVFDGSALPAGVYLVRLEAEAGVVVRPVTLVR